ncbi:hypothetical protein [Salinigranum sp. GCM10025319]|uniref:hypothetical protein n=1 Tax=Salinigranum sp. GCM10025319 TaxID=3252687 RepID=UPI00361CD357
MNSLIAVSLWITLVTVIPGLITIATLFGAGTIVDPDLVARVDVQASQWLWLSVAVTVMILTQAFGIILEGVLVDRRRLGNTEIPRDEGVLEPAAYPEDTIRPYEEYERLYFLLVRLEEKDDAYGHLERAVAQFFLTNNTLVSFAIGIVGTLSIVAASVLVRGPTVEVLLRGGIYLGLLAVALGVSYAVAVARFEVMTKSAWSLRTRPTIGATGPAPDDSPDASPRPLVGATESVGSPSASESPTSTHTGDLQPR